MYFRVAGRDVHLPKLIGAFILFAALLMFIQASAVMFDSWDTAKETNKCLQLAAANNARVDPSEDVYPLCQDLAKDYLGIRVRHGQESLTVRQFWGALLAPIAGILFWLAMLFFGYILYKTGDLVLPIEEDIKIIPEQEKPARPFRKKK